MAIKRFMVVDSFEDNRLTMKAVLGSMQYADVSLANGAEGLELIEPKKVEFILVGWEMTPMSGSAFCQRLRARAAWRNLPVLIYSAKISPEEAKLTAEIGIDNIIPQPIDREVATGKIREMVEQEEAIDDATRVFRQACGMVEDENFTGAIASAKECLSNEKLFVPAHTLLGHAFLQQNEYRESEDALNKVLGSYADHTPAIQLKAKLFSRTNRHQMAIDMLMRLLEFSPFNIGTLLSLSSVYTDTDQMEKAKETLKKVQQIDPENPEAQQQLGIIAFKEGDIQLAKEFLAKTAKGLDLARSLNNIAIGLSRKDRFDDSVSAYRAAMEILTGSRHLPLVQYNLGLAMRKQGKLIQAQQHLGRSFLANPSFEKAYGAFIKCVREMRDKKASIDADLFEEVRTARKRAANDTDIELEDDPAA